MVGRKRPLQLLQPVGENGVVAFGHDRQPVVVVVEIKRPVLETQGQFAVLQNRPVLVAEDGIEHLVLQLLFDRLPVDVEKIGVPRARAVFEQIHPPEVLPALDAHVIRHDVEQQPQVVAAQLDRQGRVLRFAPQLRVQAVGIEDVVAVQASRPGLETGRGVEVADPQPVQVADEVPSVVEAEVPVELQPVGGDGNARSIEKGIGHRGSCLPLLSQAGARGNSVLLLSSHRGRSSRERWKPRPRRGRRAGLPGPGSPPRPIPAAPNRGACGRADDAGEEARCAPPPRS